MGTYDSITRMIRIGDHAKKISSGSWSIRPCWSTLTDTLVTFDLLVRFFGRPEAVARDDDDLRVFMSEKERSYLFESTLTKLFCTDYSTVTF